LCEKEYNGANDAGHIGPKRKNKAGRVSNIKKGKKYP